MIRHTTIGLSTAAGLCAVALSASPALAAQTYTVSAGTQTTGTATFSSTTTGTSPQLTFVDTTSGLQVGCTSSGQSGTFKLGAGMSGAGIGSITASSFTGCTGPLGIQMKVTQNTVWSVNGTGSTSLSGVTAGTVSNISATSSAVQGGCTLTVSGTVKSVLTTTTKKQTLTVKPTGGLTISNVVGCFGQVRNGDQASLAATWAFTSPAGKIKVSNP